MMKSYKNSLVIVDSKESIDRMKKKVKSKDRVFDFNNIIPVVNSFYSDSSKYPPITVYLALQELGTTLDYEGLIDIYGTPFKYDADTFEDTMRHDISILSKSFKEKLLTIGREWVTSDVMTSKQKLMSIHKENWGSSMNAVGSSCKDVLNEMVSATGNAAMIFKFMSFDGTPDKVLNKLAELFPDASMANSVTTSDDLYGSDRKLQWYHTAKD